MLKITKHMSTMHIPCTWRINAKQLFELKFMNMLIINPALYFSPCKKGNDRLKINVFNLSQSKVIKEVFQIHQEILQRLSPKSSILIESGSDPIEESQIISLDVKPKFFFTKIRRANKIGQNCTNSDRTIF